MDPTVLSTVSMDKIPEYSKALYVDDNEILITACQKLRRVLSIEKHPPIQQVIDCGVTPRLVELLHRIECPKLQFEAAWALTNIASGTSEHTRAVVDAGAVPLFIRLIMSPEDDVREQAVWALGNISGDSVACRDYVLRLGAVSALVKLGETFDENSRISTIRNTTWAISNLCRGKPAPDFASVQIALPLLGRLIFSTDSETVTDACWALSYLSDGPNDHIATVLSSGVAPRIVELLGKVNGSVQTPALRTVGNIVTGTDEQTQFILNLNVVPHLLAMLSHEKKNIRKEACWTLSNITAGTTDQIQMIIDSQIIPKLIEILHTSEFEIQKEAAWTVSNITSGGSTEQILYMVKTGAIAALCNLLNAQDSKIITVVLEGLENMLKVGLNHKPNIVCAVATDDFCRCCCKPPSVYEGIKILVHECGGIEKIEALQSHFNASINNRALKLLTNHFEAYVVKSEQDKMGRLLSEPVVVIGIVSVVDKHGLSDDLFTRYKNLVRDFPEQKVFLEQTTLSRKIEKAKATMDTKLLRDLTRQRAELDSRRDNPRDLETDVAKEVVEIFLDDLFELLDDIYAYQRSLINIEELDEADKSLVVVEELEKIVRIIDSSDEGEETACVECCLGLNPVNLCRVSRSGRILKTGRRAKNASTPRGHGATTDVFISHCWGKDKNGRDNHIRAKKLGHALTARGFRVWIDEERLNQSQDIYMAMADGIENTKAFIVCVTETYAAKVNGTVTNDNCKYEFDHNYHTYGTDITLPVVFESNMKSTKSWKGKFACLASLLYVDCTEDKETSYDEIATRLHQIINTDKKQETFTTTATSSLSPGTPSAKDYSTALFHSLPQSSSQSPAWHESNAKWSEFVEIGETIAFWAPVLSSNRFFFTKKYVIILTSTCRLILVDSKKMVSKYSLNCADCGPDVFTLLDANNFKLTFETGEVKVFQDDLNGSEFWISHIKGLGGFAKQPGEKRK